MGLPTLRRRSWSTSITVSLPVNEYAIAKMTHRVAMDVMMVGCSDWTKVDITQYHYRRKHSDPLLGFRRSVKTVLRSLARYRRAGFEQVSSDEEAIRLMNDSPYGLTASIWTNAQENRDSEEAFLHIVEELQTGTVFLNR